MNFLSNFTTIIIFLYDLFSLNFLIKIYFRFCYQRKTRKKQIHSDFKLENVLEVKNEQKNRLNRNYKFQSKFLPFMRFIFVKIATSGSTGQPVFIYFFFLQRIIIAAHAFILREKNEFFVRRGYVLIWGNSSQVGKKFKCVNLTKLKDFLFRRKRFGAYRIEKERLQEFFDTVENVEQIYGYAFALSDYCSELDVLGLSSQKNIKIILTSETVSNFQINLIKRVFPNSRIIIEYGCVELGVLAITDPQAENPFELLFDNTRLSFEFVDRNIIVNNVFIGTTYFREYYVGDLVGSFIRETANGAVFHNISGRINDMLTFQKNGDTISIHSEFFSHVMNKVTTNPFSVLVKNNKIIINCVEQMSEESINFIRDAWFSETDLFEVEFEFLFSQKVKTKFTANGKQKYIWQETEG